MDTARGRPLFEQRFSKGPKAHYAVSVHERAGGTFEVIYRWENPKSADSKNLPCRSRERAMSLCQQKVDELTARGYDQHPAVVRETPSAPDAAPTAVHQSLHDLACVPGEPAEPEPLEALLARRRREAAWALE